MIVRNLKLFIRSFKLLCLMARLGQKNGSFQRDGCLVCKRLQVCEILAAAFRDVHPQGAVGASPRKKGITYQRAIFHRKNDALSCFDCLVNRFHGMFRARMQAFNVDLHLRFNLSITGHENNACFR